MIKSKKETCEKSFKEEFLEALDGYDEIRETDKRLQCFEIGTTLSMFGIVALIGKIGADYLVPLAKPYVQYYEYPRWGEGLKKLEMPIYHSLEEARREMTGGCYFITGLFELPIFIGASTSKLRHPGRYICSRIYALGKSLSNILKRCE